MWFGCLLDEYMCSDYGVSHIFLLHPWNILLFYNWRLVRWSNSEILTQEGHTIITLENFFKSTGIKTLKERPQTPNISLLSTFAWLFKTTTKYSLRLHSRVGDTFCQCVESLNLFTTIISKRKQSKVVCEKEHI